MAVYDTLKGGLGNKVAYASGGSSPSQWAEYTPARGRCVCGLPSSGTNEGTVGTAFTDDQDKSFTIDTHSVSEAEMPSHGHDINFFGYVSQTNYGPQRDYRQVPVRTCGGDGAVSTTSGDNATWGSKGLTGSGSAHGHGTVATSDFLAYIQLMSIKKNV